MVVITQKAQRGNEGNIIRLIMLTNVTNLQHIVSKQEKTPNILATG